MGTPYILLFLTLLQFSGGHGELLRIPKNETAQTGDSNVRVRLKVKSSRSLMFNEFVALYIVLPINLCV